jgi:hypothetical protein
MKRFVAATAIAGFITLGMAAPAFAATPGNPSGTGNPTQSCQNVVAAGGQEPGNASSAQGSAFNEPTATSPGGTGGLNYAGNGPATAGKTTSGVGLANNGGLVTSQYDVACYHQPAP